MRRRPSGHQPPDGHAGTDGPQATGAEIDRDLADAISQLNENLDTAVLRSVDLHRSGAPDDAVLAETAVAVGAAKAIELLTGESMEAQLEQREEEAPPAPPAPPGRRAWLRRDKTTSR